MVKNNKIISFLHVLIAIFAVLFCFAEFHCDKACAEEVPLTSAKAMALIEKKSGRILYSFNEEERLPMASTTKIITAIYAIENNSDLDKIIEIPKEATNIEGTSIGLKVGEHLTIRELLYGLMLRSGNDAAVALAIATCGSEEKFVESVNEFLKDKGFNNTRLKNPHGLPSEDHFTTASDLAKITAYALSNTTFAEIVSTKKIKISNELKSKFSRDLVNKNKLLNNYEFADGVKTGYTRKAGRCFVGSATKGDMQLVCVLLNCGPMFEDCQKLLEKGFEEYKMYKLISKSDKLGNIAVQKSKIENMGLYLNSDFEYPLKREELKDVNFSVKYEKEKSAPIKKGEELAEVQVKIKNQLIFSKKIYNI
ncbi:MAG: D-alanyl-D-alanine carboxypeptidase, partial [Clostridia bacterium]|nr:D-alanyl-D-alanine carboxypeptidase [Clostridia bacterium]